MANAESAQEYQDDDFSDELGLSDPPHPLFPTSLDSNYTVIHRNWQARGRSRISEQQVLTLWHKVYAALHSMMGRNGLGVGYGVI